MAIWFLILQVAFMNPGFGQNPAQWRGSQRNGVYDEQGLLKEWPVEGPAMSWFSEEIGQGWGSPAVTGDAVLIIGKKDKTDYCTALNHTGQVLWQVPIGDSWDGSYNDARSTPTVVDSKVYAISGKGQIVCLDALTGKTIWEIDGYKKFNGLCTLWGVCESPLIIDDKLFYTPGGTTTTLVALDRNTGETIWKSESLRDSTAYVSPLAVPCGDKNIIATISANYFFGLDAKDGKILWKYKYSDLKWEQTHWYSPIINCNTPLYHKGEFLISKGYNHLAASFRMEPDGSAIELVRTDSVFDVHIGGMVLHKGYVYGSNWIHNQDGNWCCIDWETGKMMYEAHWECKGSIICADDMLYCYDEKKGNLALVRPDPTKFDLVSSFRITKGSGQHWAHPVIQNGILYVRHGKALMAYNIKKVT